MLAKRKIISVLAVICLLMGLTAILPVQADFGAQMKDKSDKQKGDKDKKDKKKDDKDKDKDDKTSADEMSSGRALMWREPTDIESRDLFHGRGGAEDMPDPSGKFTFVRRSTGGTRKRCGR